MSNQHTPGPWICTDDGRIPVLVFERNGKTSVAIVSDGLKRGPIDFREVAANAQLIAEAPALLAALEAIVGEADLGEVDLEPEDFAKLETAREVIARAKGQK